MCHFQYAQYIFNLFWWRYFTLSCPLKLFILNKIIICTAVTLADEWWHVDGFWFPEVLFQWTSAHRKETLITPLRTPLFPFCLFLKYLCGITESAEETLLKMWMSRRPFSEKYDSFFSCISFWPQKDRNCSARGARGSKMSSFCNYSCMLL